jgi:hypothetical protein
MAYADRLRIYESMKKQIEKSAKSSNEYERRIIALANKLRI